MPMPKNQTIARWIHHSSFPEVAFGSVGPFFRRKERSSGALAIRYGEGEVPDPYPGCGPLGVFDRLGERRWGRRVGYERTEVHRLPGCHRYDRGGGDNEDEDEGVGTDGTGDRCVGWDGWPQKWPETMGEMKRRIFC